MYILCVILCLFNTLSCGVVVLQVSIITIIKKNGKSSVNEFSENQTMFYLYGNTFMSSASKKKKEKKKRKTFCFMNCSQCNEINLCDIAAAAHNYSTHLYMYIFVRYAYAVIVTGPQNVNDAFRNQNTQKLIQNV